MTADEHSRWRSFLGMLEDLDELSEPRIAQYLDLACAEPIGGVGESAVIHLIADRGITKKALDAIEERLPADWKAANARLAERRVRLPLEQGLTDDEHQLEAVRQGSRSVHLWLLDNVDLSEEALRGLSAEGATRAVRNRATQRLHRR